MTETWEISIRLILNTLSTRGEQLAYITRYNLLDRALDLTIVTGIVPQSDGWSLPPLAPPSAEMQLWLPNSLLIILRTAPAEERWGLALVRGLHRLVWRFTRELQADILCRAPQPSSCNLWSQSATRTQQFQPSEPDGFLLLPIIFWGESLPCYILRVQV